jgi:hypothetical protein
MRVRLRVRPLHRILISLVLRGFSYLSGMPLLAPIGCITASHSLSANRSLKDRFVPDYNGRFAMPAAEPGSAFVAFPIGMLLRSYGS